MHVKPLEFCNKDYGKKKKTVNGDYKVTIELDTTITQSPVWRMNTLKSVHIYKIKCKIIHLLASLKVAWFKILVQFEYPWNI